MSFFLLCALSERVRCKELVHIRETQAGGHAWACRLVGPSHLFVVAYG